MIDPILLFDDNFWGSDTDFSNADSKGARRASVARGRHAAFKYLSGQKLYYTERI